ncbi:MAG TPA: glycosyltransferase family 1 protein [Bryobacteraceae bacterium]|jgi:glycosyltransferase involved in cell wall biosynthesis|nr:glycosyltransferase family 1 protein [Bryobacteraceae bacterium]
MRTQPATMRIGYDTLIEDPLKPSSAIDFLRRHLVALSSAGPTCQFYVFVSPKNRDFFYFEAPNVIFVNCFVSNECIPLRIAVQQFYYPILARRLRLDVMFGLNQLPILCGCPTVVKTCTVHHRVTPENFLDSRDGGHFNRLRLVYRRFMFDISARRASIVMANSKATQEVIRTTMRVPAKNIEVVYEAVDTAFGERPPSAASSEITLQLGLRSAFILYVSTLWHYKNPDGAIRAFARQKEKYNDDLDLALVGSDDFGIKPDLERLAHSLGVGDRVHFLGKLPQEKLLQLFGKARMLFYPSRAETFGKPLVEAMLASLPIVAARATCLPEILAGAGLLAAPDDPEEMAEALHRAHTDEALRSELIAKGHVRARDFSWEKTASGTLECCRKAVQKTVRITL